MHRYFASFISENCTIKKIDAWRLTEAPLFVVLTVYLFHLSALCTEYHGKARKNFLDGGGSLYRCRYGQYCGVNRVSVALLLAAVLEHKMKVDFCTMVK